MLFVPQEPSTRCQVSEMAGPSGWITAYESSNGHAEWALNDPKNYSCVLPGSQLEGFTIAFTTVGPCCYNAFFYGALPEYFAQDTVCFSCDGVVPVQRETWGKVKAIYRN